jgi:hypothetical protein
MSEALETAYASNEATPLVTVEFAHSAFDGGYIRLVQSFYDLTATTENSETVTFNKSGINLSLPEKTTDGRQDLRIEIDNVSNAVWTEIKKAVTANRTTQEKINCTFRNYLEADLSAPAGPVYKFVVSSTSINITTATIIASYTPIPDTYYPRYRYYPTVFSGVKYA